MSQASDEKDGHRRAPRVPGPFEGRIIGESTVDIRIHALSVVGCLIQSAHHVPVGRQMTIEIDLPYEGTVTLEAESVNARIQCVRVVHGKGLRSGPRGPVLKASVNRWLRQWDDVLAFVSAPARDGGTGAVYVLLRR